MNRRVARIDISNPVTTGFTVTGIEGTSNLSVPLFIDEFGSGNGIYPKKTLSNATAIPAALYLYPSLGSRLNPGTPIKLHGIHAGNPVTLSTKTKLLPNTRYVLAVRNDESNLRLDITVAPWNDGGTIDTPDVGGTYNSHVTFEGSSRQTGVYTIDTVNRTLTYTAATFKNGDEFLTLRGAARRQEPHRDHPPGRQLAGAL